MSGDFTVPGVWGECSFLTAHEHILGHLVPYDGVEGIIKEWRYKQGCLAIDYTCSCSL